MKFEDHFSELATTYSKYRPSYPPVLFEFLSSCCHQHQQAWDCGTGNRQDVRSLADHFDKVFATA